MDQHKLNNHSPDLARKRIETHGERGQGQYETVPRHSAKERDSRELPEITLCILYIASAHALSDHRDVDWPHRHHHQRSQRPQALRYAVGRDLRGSEHGRNAAERDLYQLERAIFDAVRHRDVKDFFHRRRIIAEHIRLSIPYAISGSQAKTSHRHGREHSRDNGRPRDAGNAGMENKDAEGVPCYIDDVGKYRDLQRDGCFPFASTDGRAGVIYSQCGKRIS